MAEAIQHTIHGLVVAALVEAGGHRGRAAVLLGMHDRSFRRLLSVAVLPAEIARLAELHQWPDRGGRRPRDG